jgi:hypothetical protein
MHTFWCAGAGPGGLSRMATDPLGLFELGRIAESLNLRLA